MTYDELVEKVARAMNPTTSSIVDRLIQIGADRLEAIQLLPLQEATVAIATIRAALQEPTESMLEAGYAWDEYVTATETHPRNRGLCRAMLAASPLGEKSE